jgi:hypothetical protein
MPKKKVENFENKRKIALESYKELEKFMDLNNLIFATE